MLGVIAFCLAFKSCWFLFDLCCRSFWRNVKKCINVMLCYDVKRPPELYKICNINFYKRKWPPTLFINFIKNRRFFRKEPLTGYVLSANHCIKPVGTSVWSEMAIPCLQMKSLSNHETIKSALHSIFQGATSWTFHYNLSSGEKRGWASLHMWPLSTAEAKSMRSPHT